MAAKGGKKSKAAKAEVEIANTVTILQTAYRAACRAQGATPSKVFVSMLDECIENPKHINRIMFREEDMDGKGVRFVTDAVAAYPPLKSLCFLRCSLGDAGVSAVADLLAAGTDPWTKGPRLRLVEILDDQESTRAAIARTATLKAPRPSETPAPPAAVTGGGQPGGMFAFAEREFCGGGRPHCLAVEDVPWGTVSWIRTASSSDPIIRSDGERLPRKNPPKISPEAIDKLGRALCLPACPLQRLALDHNDIGDEGVKILTTSLLRNSSIQVLSLGYNNISAKGASYIADCLLPINATRLIQLNLQGNPLQGRGLESLGRGVANAATLSVLNISSIHLEREDTPHILTFCTILHNNTSLKKLDIGCNELNATSANALVNMYIEKTSLLHLRLNERIAPHLMAKVAALLVERNKKVKKKGVKKKKKK